MDAPFSTGSRQAWWIAGPKVTILPLVVLLLVSACDAGVVDTPTAPSGSLAHQETPGIGTPLPRFPELAPETREVHLDVDRLPPDLEGEDLVAAITEADGRVFIGFKPWEAPSSRQTGIVPGMSRAEALEGRVVVLDAGGSLERSFIGSAIVVARIAPEAALELLEHPLVDRIDPIGPPLRTTGGARSVVAIEPPPRLRLISSEPDTAWGVKRIRAPQVWNWSEGNQGAGDGSSYITVLDSGIDETHWTTYQAYGSSELDIRLPVSRCLFVQEYSSSCLDEHGHGSHVLGIAAENGWNEWIGVAPLVRLSVVKVCEPVNPENLSLGVGCERDAVATALDWTANNGLPRQIVNMSFTQDVNQSVTHEQQVFLQHSYDAGNLLVSGVGNTPVGIGESSAIGWPANDPKVIAVTGTLENDEFADHENFACNPWYGPPIVAGSKSGPEAELAAPFWAESMILNGNYGRDCGTSMSAPHVSGVAALVWTKNPTWAASTVRNRLRETAVGGSWSPELGHGRVDAWNAVQDPPDPPPCIPTPPQFKCES